MKVTLFNIQHVCKSYQNNVPALSVCAVFCMFCMSLLVLLFCPLYHHLWFSVSDYLFDTFKHSFHILIDVVISFKLRSSPPNPNIILFFRWFLMFIIPICCGFGKIKMCVDISVCAFILLINYHSRYTEFRG